MIGRARREDFTRILRNRCCQSFLHTIQDSGLLCQHAQLAEFRVGQKGHAALFQNPCLNAFMVHAQQIDRPPNVILLAHALRRVALDLGADSSRDIEPFAQTGEATPQAVKSEPVQARSHARLAVRNARFGNVA